MREEGWVGVSSEKRRREWWAGGRGGCEEGEGVVGRTYCIQPENNNVTVVVNNLHCMDAMSLTGTQPNACYQLVCVVKQ